MPTTTNYGWTTPADTDLVKDGASAIRTLGTAIDTTVFNNASAAIAKTIVDAKGDLIAATAADTVARLAVGTNGQTLVADSAEATGLKWATASSGGMTLINTPSGTTLTGSSVTIGSIPATYNYLILIIENFLPATDATGIFMRFNSDSNTRYRTTSDADTSDLAFNENYMYIVVNTDNSSGQGISISSIYGYANSTTWKYCTTESIGNNAGTPTSVNFRRWRNVYNQTSAITSLTLTPDSGNYTSGTAYLYGVK